MLGFFIVYGLVRAGLEQFRGDLGRGELLNMSTSTAIGLSTAAIAFIALLPPLSKYRPQAPVLTRDTKSDEGSSEKADEQSGKKADKKAGKKADGKQSA